MSDGKVVRTMQDVSLALATMDVPQMRRSLTADNARWMLRNLAIDNKQNPLLVETMSNLRWLLAHGAI